MREINLEIDKQSFKDELGIKDIDLTPIVKSISVLEKAIKDKKFEQKDSSEIEKTLKLILEKKEDNTEVISAIRGLALLAPKKSSGIDYTTKFNQLMDTITSSNQLRAGYNPSVPQIRNVAEEVINPATEEKQDEIVTAIEATEETLQTVTVKQDSQTEILTTLSSLTETLQELTSRLNVIASMANSGQPSLRVTPLSTPNMSTLTTVTNLTNFGTAYPASEMAHDINNFTAIVANINNVTVS